MAFDLSAMLKEVSGPDTGKQQIQYIDLALIDPNPDNFYSRQGIDELAGSIEMLGLQQPLLVRPAQGGRYTVISGHRRRAALMLIRDGGSQQFADGVPCIVDRSEASAALQELKLIMANSDTRKMSSADQNTQAERIEDLLRQLVDEGFEFPGRLRDWVAKLSGMSRTKLARLKVIRDKLDKSLFTEKYQKNGLGETAAYALAQQPVEMQRRICDAWLAKNKDLVYMGESFVKEYTDLCAQLAKRKCAVAGNKGCPCTNQARILDKAFDGNWSYKPCKHNCCCADCDQYLHCKSRCPLLDEKAKAERAKQREASAEARAAEKAKSEADVRMIEQIWGRYGQALRGADLTDAQLRARLKKEERYFCEFTNYMKKDTVKALLDFEITDDVKSNTSLPFHYSMHVGDALRLCRFADELGCSVDFLLGRTDQPQPAAVSAPARDLEAATYFRPDGKLSIDGIYTALDWQTGQPLGDGRYLCLVDMNTGKLHEQRCEYRDGVWLAYGQPIHELFSVKAWWPLPPEMLKMPHHEPETDPEEDE